MGLERKTIEVKTEHGVFNIPAWTDGRVVCNDPEFFGLVQKKQKQAYGHWSRKELTKARQEEGERGRARRAKIKDKARE